MTAAELVEKIAMLTAADPARIVSRPGAGSRSDIVIPGDICERLVELAMVGDAYNRMVAPAAEDPWAWARVADGGLWEKPSGVSA